MHPIVIGPSILKWGILQVKLVLPFSFWFEKFMWLCIVFMFILCTNNFYRNLVNHYVRNSSSVIKYISHHIRKLCSKKTNPHEKNKK